MTLRLALAVPSEGPLYEGHFPGRPILPGIGLLDLSMRALAGEGISSSIIAIPSLRLRKLVSPGDRLVIDVKAVEADGSVRFDVRRETEIVANVSVVTGETSTDVVRLDATANPRPVNGSPGLDMLLPHRPPMRFLERIDTEFDEGVSCSVSVPARSPFTDDGSAPSLVAVEMAAQSAAAFETLRRGRLEKDAGPRIGYLVGARDVRLARARTTAGRTFIATIRLAGFAPPLSTYDFSIDQDGVAIASGTMGAWLTAIDV